MNPARQMHTWNLAALGIAIAILVLATGPGRGQGLQFKAEYEDNDDLFGGIDGLGAVSAVALSPDGTSLYAIGSLEDSLAVFRRDPATGLLTFVTAYFDDDSNSPHAGGVNLGLDSPRDVAVSMDSRHVYATGLLDQAVGVFSRTAATGTLTFVEAETDPVNLRGAFGLVVSPDDAHVYVTGRSSDSVTAFVRDNATGALGFLEAEINGSGGVGGLDSVEGIAISPDGKHVYTAAGSDLNFTGSNAIAAFARDNQPASGTFGRLTFVESLFEGGTDGSGNTVDGLNEVSRLTVSPDGRHVYAVTNVDSSADPDWIAVFSRDPATGRLTFVESHPGPPDPPFSLSIFCAGVISDCGVAVHPGGDVVYACNSNGLGVFARDQVTGRLTFSELECGYFGLGVSTTEDVVVSADGKHVYTAEFPFGVAVLATEALTYHEWAACFPGLLDPDPLADPDFDGRVNLIEFAFDLDPTQPQPDFAEELVPRPGVEGDHLALSFSLPFPPREDLLLEVFATSGPGAPQLVASKTGAGAWTGPANVTTGDPFRFTPFTVSDPMTVSASQARLMWVRVTLLAGP